MPYPAKITPEQWMDIERRVTAGESVTSLAKEYGVSEAALRKRGASKQKVRKVRKVAVQLAEAKTALAALPPDQQILAVALADELRAISSNLASAARYGSATAQRLAQAAHDEIQHAEVLDEETLRSVAMITRTANEAGQLGVALLKANEESMREASEREAKRAMQVTRIRLVPMTAG